MNGEANRRIDLADARCRRLSEVHHTSITGEQRELLELRVAASEVPSQLCGEEGQRVWRYTNPSKSQRLRYLPYHRIHVRKARHRCPGWASLCHATELCPRCEYPGLEDNEHVVGMDRRGFEHGR